MPSAVQRPLTYRLLAHTGVLLLLLGGAPLARAADEWQESYARKEHVSGGQTLRYRLFTPPPRADGCTLPLVVLLHGGGQCGGDNIKQLVHGAHDFLRRQEQHPCFVLAPQCPAGKRWVEVDWGGKAGAGTFPAEPSVPMAQTIELVDALVASGAVDPDRIYITGLSMGGYGTWYAAGMPGRRFAAAAPMCGGGDPLWTERFIDLPVWAFHGDLDNVVPVCRSREIIDAIRAAGGNPKYTEYQRVGHNCWTQTYADDAFHEWLFAQRRPAAPLATPAEEWQESYARKEHVSGGQKLRYRLLTPAPRADGGTLPLVVFLHGAGERGADNAAQLRHGASDFQRRQERHPCFVLIPQCPANKRWVEVHWGGKAGTGTFPAEPSVPLAQTLEVADGLIASGAVDPDRVYITGLSMGGYGTWYAAGMPGRRFAAAAPMCGGGDPLWTERYIELPLWAFHGDLDTTVPPVRSREMIDAIRAAGGNPKYTEYQRVGHNCWAQTYADDAFHEWLFAQRRPAPTAK